MTYMAQKLDFTLPFQDLTNFVPSNLRNPVVEALLDNLFNRHMTHDESVPFYGYVGRRPTSTDDRTPRIPEATVERDINGIIPVFSFKLGSEQVAFTAQDIINAAGALGIDTEDLSWLYSQGSNFVPPIDLDKFTNFFNYFWVAKALPNRPVLDWNPGLEPEYYVIKTPQPSDADKANARVATTANVTLTGTGFVDKEWTVRFVNPTLVEITSSPAGFGAYTPIADAGQGQTLVSGNVRQPLTSLDQQIEYKVQSGPTTITAITFNIKREPVYDSGGVVVGNQTFVTNDTFVITAGFNQTTYQLAFTPGGPAALPRGTLYKVSTYSTYQTIDGVQVQEGDRVLVKNQGDAAENGIYVVKPGAWVRAVDFDGVTIASGARIFVREGATQSSTGWQSTYAAPNVTWNPWAVVPANESNTSDWQEGNYWVKGDELSALGLDRAEVEQAVRPIIEYSSTLRLNQRISGGLPVESGGTAYKQKKTIFNQLPMFDLYRYDGAHSNLVSSIFYYVEDPAAELDVALQRRVKKAANASADFVFNHGLTDANGNLLFYKLGSSLASIWQGGFIQATYNPANDQYFAGEGDGTLSVTVTNPDTQQQFWTLTALSPTTFKVEGSKLKVLPSPLDVLTVGTPYSNSEFSATITAGSTPFVAGDTFVFRVGNLERPRYVYRDANLDIYDLYGGAENDFSKVGAYQVSRSFINNPYNETRSEITEGAAYTHFRSIMDNQLEGKPMDTRFGGTIKLWSEQHTLFAALLMQKDVTPISMIDLAQRQYEVGLNAVRDIFQQHLGDYLATNPVPSTPADFDNLLSYIQQFRALDADVRTVIYDSTAALLGFPATLPQLGVKGRVSPTVEYDPVIDLQVLVHHDGHKSPLFTNTYEFVSATQGYQPDGTINGVAIDVAGTLNTLLLLVEQKLYDGCNPNHRVFNFTPLLSDVSFQRQLERELFTYAALNGYDPLASDYVAEDAFTWNYSQATWPVAMQAGGQRARWFDAIKTHQDAISGVIPTERPDLEPWKLRNYSTFSTWWASLTPTQQNAYTPYATPDDLSSGFINGGTVKAAATVNVTRSGINTVAHQAAFGTTTAAGDLVLLTGQASPQFNGVWVVSAGTWFRPVGSTVIANTYFSVTSGTERSTIWTYANTPATIDVSPISVRQVRYWSDAMWADIKAARPGLKLSVDPHRDVLLPPYVSPSGLGAAEALLNVTPPGTRDTYAFGENGPVESVWERSLEYGYSLARALFRYDPMAFLGFCWGFPWVTPSGQAAGETGLLLDSYDISMPGHKRFRLHGEPVTNVVRATPMSITTVVGDGVTPIDVTFIYDGYQVSGTTRRQSFSVRVTGEDAAYGYVPEQVVTTVTGVVTLTGVSINDRGIPFRMGDRFRVTANADGTNVVIQFLPTERYQFRGFGQVFTHALRDLNVDTTTSSYGLAAYREWDVNMGYRAGGLVATDDLTVLTTSEQLSPASFTLLFKRNPVAKDAWLQGLRVSVLSFGGEAPGANGYKPAGSAQDWVFRIEGYNPRYLFLEHYTTNTVASGDEFPAVAAIGDRFFHHGYGGQYVFTGTQWVLSDTDNIKTFNALEKRSCDLTWYQPTENVGTAEVYLPMTITGLQNVVNFLFGYSRFVTDMGWEIALDPATNVDAETGRIKTWQLEIERLIDRVYSGIDTGQGVAVDPFIDQVWFRQDTGLISKFNDTPLFDITGHPGMFDTLGGKIASSDLFLIRRNQRSQITSAVPMFSCHVQVDEFEHLFIFNNYISPSEETGLLYDPFTGARVVTYKFNGRRQAAGTLRPEFGGHYLVGNEVRQNLQASTDNITNFFDANRVFENELTSRHALQLLGFNSKEYFDNLDISKKTQFNFWRGLIQAKGTNVSIDAYLNNNRFEDAKIDEYWAYKLAEYGDARQLTFPELKLLARDTQQQFTQLQFDAAAGDELRTFTQINSLDEARWFSIDDLGQTETYFKAEVVGTWTKNCEAGTIETLPFIADRLVIEPAAVTQRAFKVRAATTVNITRNLASTPVMDGVTLAVGDIVLVKNQNTTSANGIFLVTSSGTWPRMTEFDTATELNTDRIFFVEEGSQAGTSWQRVTPYVSYTYQQRLDAAAYIVNATTLEVVSSGVLNVVGYGPATPRYNPAKLFNYLEDQLIEEIPLWHPAIGQHTPTALESINVISKQNPARYNYSTLVENNNSFDPLRPWGERELGRVWFDTRNLAYVPYYDYKIYPDGADFSSRLSRWGALADYGTIDVYEWVKSSVPPSEYSAQAALEAGNSDITGSAKADGSPALQETYRRTRQWQVRPIAWSKSGTVFGGHPSFGPSYDAKLFISGTTYSLEFGTFAGYGISTGSRIGLWELDPQLNKPASEVLVTADQRRLFNGDLSFTAASIGALTGTVEVLASSYVAEVGELLFSSLPSTSVPDTFDDTGPITYRHQTSLRITAVDSGTADDILITNVVTDSVTPPTIAYQAGQVYTFEAPTLGLTLRFTVGADLSSSSPVLADAFIDTCDANIYLRDAVTVEVVVPEAPGRRILDTVSNDVEDPENLQVPTGNGLLGWRAWTVPTQAELDADGRQPNSIWKPYLGDLVSPVVSDTFLAEAVAYQEDPLTLNDGTVIERYVTSWSDWSILRDKLVEKVASQTGSVVFDAAVDFDADAFDMTETSVYVNGVALLASSFTVDGANLEVPASDGSRVAVIVRKYSPSEEELAFDPSTADDLTFQEQYKQDYEYVTQTIRDNDGATTSTVYYFWVKNRSTAAVGKKLSVQAIVQQLRDGPSNYLTFQHLLEPLSDKPWRYDAITISGLSYIVTRDDAYKLRFTRNFTLRDDPRDLDLKNVHTEWALIRPGQRTRIPEKLWQKLTDSVAGQDTAGNELPALRRTLYDERNGTSTRFGFGVEQILAPSELLRSTVTYTILNTRLEDASVPPGPDGSYPPDYIDFLDFNQSDSWFATPEAARQTMTDIWNQATPAQINEIFFAALEDIAASNREMTDLFKTSRLSAYSIRIIQSGSAPNVYE